MQVKHLGNGYEQPATQFKVDFRNSTFLDENSTFLFLGKNTFFSLDI